MRKIFNILLLSIWVFALILGIIRAVNGGEITPFSFVCAAGVCVIHYIDKLLQK